ncbi:copper homeostasis protein CutC, partial [Streptococcus suis]
HTPCPPPPEPDATVLTLRRPRGGDDCYAEADVEMMVEDCKAAIALGADGLVYGLLTEQNWLYEPDLERLFAVSLDCQ